ncbi:MAG: amidohydrolase family protein [Pseudomonadota bacterium]
MTGHSSLLRRRFLQLTATTALTGCADDPGGRYTAADIQQLEDQRTSEQQKRGKGRHGPQVYQGYRGLAELPWFDLDREDRLVCIDDSFPRAIDVHCHLGISVLFEPHLDLLATTPRVRHLLDCDATDPGSPLDLDIYINGNFSESQLSDLRLNTLAQGLWGSPFASTQTIPNLLAEMDAMRVEHALLLPIKLGLPFGDALTENWRTAVAKAKANERLHPGLSVLPTHPQASTQMIDLSQSGAPIVKLHPTVQRFYPDDPRVMPLYELAGELGLVVFFHGGRAGIEPKSSHRYAMPRHYEAPLAEFPKTQFILGHGGARDGAAMLQLGARYDNAWLGLHGQGVSRLEDIIQRTGGERLLFGSDWPFYHLGATLAKVLIVTNDPSRRTLRERILRDNALSLFPAMA